MSTASIFSNFFKAIKEAHTDDERNNLYEKLMQTNIAENNLGIIGTRRFVEYLDMPNSFTIGFESVEDLRSFEQILDNAGFLQGQEYVSYGNFKYAVTFAPDEVVYPYGITRDFNPHFESTPRLGA